MNTSSSNLNEICDMLNTYGGRDKVMKALCYTTKLAAGLSGTQNPELSKSLTVFSSKISGARATLRLIDDIPMLRHTLEYGWGKQEPDRTMSILGVFANIVDHIYYPIDKICWFAEHKVVNVENQTKWDTLSSVFWVTSIYCNLMKTMRYVAMMEQHKNCINKLETSSSDAIARLLVKQKMEVISIVRLSLDLTQAVSTLPKGYLWGGKLESWHVGLIGSLSAFIGIYQFFMKKNLTN